MSRRPGDGLVIDPFRGWSFDPARVQVDDAVCPPYDVVEPEDDEWMRRRSPHNVVRLVRPKGPPVSDGSRPRTRYEQAADLLTSWRQDGTLVRAPEPALYVYEQRGRGGAQRGVIGAVEVRDPADGVVVPHEDVFAGPVADRLALMTATNAQLEPILLTTDGLDPLESWLATISATVPAVLARPEDGTEHRLWPISDPAQIRVVQNAVRGSSALIADGHHRYATYRRMQAERRAAGLGAGPWDRGLVLLVGTVPGALTLGAIHRTVRGVALPVPTRDDELERTAVVVTALPDVDATDPDVLLACVAEPAEARRVRDGLAVSLVASDGSRVVRLDCRPLGAGLRDRLPATVMSERVLPELFGRDDGDRRVDYHHDAAHAISAAGSTGGVAILLPAPMLHEVRALAEAGARMPRKSTSFGPKPRSGLVLRDLDWSPQRRHGSG